MRRERVEFRIFGENTGFRAVQSADSGVLRKAGARCGCRFYSWRRLGSGIDVEEDWRQAGGIGVWTKLGGEGE